MSTLNGNYIEMEIHDAHHCWCELGENPSNSFQYIVTTISPGEVPFTNRKIWTTQLYPIVNYNAPLM